MSLPRFANDTFNRDHTRLKNTAVLQFTEGNREPEKSSDQLQVTECDGAGPEARLSNAWTRAVGFFAVLSRGIMVPRVQHSTLPYPPSIQRGFLNGYHVCDHSYSPAKAPHKLGTELSFCQICLPVPVPWLSPSQPPHQSLHSPRPSCQVCSHPGTFAPALLPQS